MTSRALSQASIRPGQSFRPNGQTIDHDQLIDLRALQRTFDGAYTRTALAQLSYAIVILRLFDRQFYWCGLIYTILAAQLIGIAIYRYNLAMANDDRWADVKLGQLSSEAVSDGNGVAHFQDTAPSSMTTPQQGPEPRRILRRTFRTAGSVVALATLGTFVLEIALVVLVIRM